jgi:hypothetical protein
VAPALDIADAATNGRLAAGNGPHLVNPGTNRNGHHSSEGWPSFISPAKEKQMKQKPRNPRYFPKMKVRGARRRELAPFHRTAGGFDGLAAVFERMTAILERYRQELRRDA